jgi:thiol-disulfide isomerase/thioredoxin
MYGRKTARGHRHSTAGKILPPIDIRSEKILHEMIKRIIKGPATIILIYADWCGHCHHVMPHFDAAAKSRKRSVQIIKLADFMLSKANMYMNDKLNAEDLKPEGYPCMYIKTPDGKTQAEHTPAPDQKQLEEFMTKSGTFAEQAQLGQKPQINRKTMSKKQIAELVATTQIRNTNMNSIKPAGEPAIRPDFIKQATSFKLPSLKDNSLINGSVEDASLKNASLKNASLKTKSVKAPPIITVDTTLPKLETTVPDIKKTTKKLEKTLYTSSMKKALSDTTPTQQEVDQITSMKGQLTDDHPPIALPSSPTSDEQIIQSPLTVNQKLRGGSLYASMAKTAYTLSPTAALLATAALTLKHHKKHRRSTHRKK